MSDFEQLGFSSRTSYRLGLLLLEALALVPGLARRAPKSTRARRANDNVRDIVTGSRLKGARDGSGAACTGSGLVLISVLETWGNFYEAKRG